MLQSVINEVSIPVQQIVTTKSVGLCIRPVDGTTALGLAIMEMKVLLRVYHVLD